MEGLSPGSGREAERWRADRSTGSSRRGARKFRNKQPRGGPLRVKRTLITLVALTIAAITTAAGPAESRHTFFVDDDKQQCPQADFGSIGAAISVATPGDAIKVCPGLYSESIVVN